MAHRLGLVNILILNTMIGKNHHEGVLPCGCLLQFVDEVAQANIQEIECIEDRIIELLLHRHSPWLMTAQRKHRSEPRLNRGLNLR